MPGNRSPGPGPASRILARFADFCRRYADRLDPAGAYRDTSLSFTFEPGTGITFRDDGRGCQIGLVAGQLPRAAAEAGTPGGWAWLPSRPGLDDPWPPAGWARPHGTPPLFSWPASAGYPEPVTLHTEPRRDAP